MASSKEEKNEERIVLFSKENADNIDEIWDDTALIRAYEKSVRKIKKVIKSKSKTLYPNEQTDSSVSEKGACLAKDISNEQETDEVEPESSASFEWKVGDICSAIYTEDNVLYPATITKIFKDKKQAEKCIIKYLYYLNEEEKYLNELYEYEELEVDEKDDEEEMINEEDTNMKRNPQQARTDSSKKETIDFFTNALPDMPVPPMLPYELMSRLTLKNREKNKGKKNKAKEEQEEDEAILNSMLMSWYMSGYHTGFYYGLNHSKKRFN